MFNVKSITQRRAFSKVYKNYVNGQWVASAGTSHIDIINPLDSTEVLAKVPQSTEAEFNSIVQNSQDTFDEWKEVPISTKIRMMLRYQELLKQNNEKLDTLIDLMNRFLGNDKDDSPSISDIINKLESDKKDLKQTIEQGNNVIEANVSSYNQSSVVDGWDDF